eukprot:gene282-911_t
MRVLDVVFLLRLAAASNRVQPARVLESLRAYESDHLGAQDIFSREASRPPEGASSSTYISMEERFRILENEIKFLKEENKTVKKKMSILEEEIDSLKQGHESNSKDDSQESSNGIPNTHEDESTAMTIRNNDEGVIIPVHGNTNANRITPVVETLSVNASEYGASLRVLMAVFGCVLQIFMLHLLEQVIYEVQVDPSRSSFQNWIYDHSVRSKPYDAVFVTVAVCVFGYDWINSLAGPALRCIWASYHLDRRGAFARHPCPIRAHATAFFLVCLELMVTGYTWGYGIMFVSQSITKAELVLNVVALRFVIEIDDYICRLACNLGLIHDIDVPIYVVTPNPLVPVSLSLAVYFIGEATNGYKGFLSSSIFAGVEVAVMSPTAVLLYWHSPIVNAWLKGLFILIIFCGMCIPNYILGVPYPSWVIAGFFSLGTIICKYKRGWS